MAIPAIQLSLSGERFQVLYTIAGDKQEALEKAEAICVEQTVEFPQDLLPPGSLRDEILGRIEAFHPVDRDHYQAWVSYAVDIAGSELPQLLNVIFGNTSIKPGIRVERLELPQCLLDAFKGPRFGRSGLRQFLKVYDRPLLCTALKPMGLGPKDLAHLAYQFALGGIDIIKDDHGIADQSFSRFKERIQLCAASVEKANRETGLGCIYVANIMAPFDQIMDRAKYAKAEGAKGLLIPPGLVGFDLMRCLAEDDNLALPIIYHPAFQGSFVTSKEQGISPYVLMGQLCRLAGADCSIFPNYGGRFSITREECQAIVEGSEVPMGHIKPIFPTPGGGMLADLKPEFRQMYGTDVIYLIGGGMFRIGPDLVSNCRIWLEQVGGIRS